MSEKAELTGKQKLQNLKRAFREHDIPWPFPERDGPDYVAQNGEKLTAEERRDWFGARTKDAAQEGCRWVRMSIHETIPNLIIFEGWKEGGPTETPPHWLLTKGTSDEQHQ